MAPRRKKPAADVESATDPSALMVDDMLEALNEKGGSSRTLRLSDDGLSIHLPGVIPTGSEFLDYSIGRGGIPLSRISMVAGNEGAGKTTLALQLCANVQRMGGVAAYIDGEYKLDRDYAAGLGVDNDRLLLTQPDDAESALETVKKIVRVARAHGSQRPILIVMDSLNALATAAELEGKDTPGANARVWSAGLKKINGMLSKQRVALLLISQMRSKIGVMFGNPNTTGGGKAPRFFSAVLIELDVVAGIKEGGTRVGNKVKVKVAKNQIAAPFRKAEFVLRFGAGIDWVHSLHETLVASGMAQKGKSGWTTWNDQRWQAANGLRALLEGDGGVEVAERLITAVRDLYGWGDAYPRTHVPALLNAGAPFAVRPGLSDDDDEDDEDDEDDDEGED